jgi:hypothetical protein
MQLSGELQDVLECGQKLVARHDLEVLLELVCVGKIRHNLHVENRREHVDSPTA